MKSVLRLTDRDRVPPRPVIDPVVAQIHERLLRNDYADSLEVRIALLADMVFRIYALNTTNANQR